MVVDLKEEIKNRITMSDACARYGISVNERGFASCPFHTDKTPSMRVYPGKRGFCCFSCGEAGDVIHFTQKLFGIPFRDAMRKLNVDFGLNILMDGTPSRQNDAQRRECERRRLQEERDKQEREEAERDYWSKFDRWKALCAQKEKYRPNPLDENLHPKFAEAVRLIPQAEIELEIAEGRRIKCGAGTQTDPTLHAG